MGNASLLFFSGKSLFALFCKLTITRCSLRSHLNTASGFRRRTGISGLQCVRNMWSNRKHMSVTLDKQMQSCGGSLRALCVRERERAPSRSCYPACQQLNSLMGNDSSRVPHTEVHMLFHSPYIYICRVMLIPYHSFTLTQTGFH